VIGVRRRIGIRLCALALSCGALSACASSGRGAIPQGTVDPDRYLFERGTEELNDRNWLTAREYFRQVIDMFSQSTYRPEAKLGVGDTYLGEGGAEALVMAIAEFQEFLQFYPTNPRADYAQFRMAMAHFRQMRAPQRDQTETRNAIREFETFIARYPGSSLMSEARARLREARDRLSTASFEVGMHYLRIKYYPGALDRFSSILKEDPEYSRRDAVYYHLGEALVRVSRQAEALPYYERLLAEYESSDYLDQSRRRVQELRALVAQN
jgi:outer membrane protein assembly factor BamD